MPTDEEIKAHVEAVWAGIRPNSPLYAFLLSSATITEASRGLVRARLALGAHHINSKGGLHGSATAALVDWAGSLAVASWDLRARTGVSADLHVAYVSSAREGDEVEVEARADRVGGALAFTRVVVYRVVDGAAGPVVATGSHSKYVRGTAPEAAP